MTKISETEFEYCRPKAGASAGGKKIPTWILLTPEEVPSVDDVDMGTGFFGPTNKENAVGGMRSNFLTSPNAQIQRPKFGPMREKKRKDPDAEPPPPGKTAIRPITAAVLSPPSLGPGQRITSIPNSRRRGLIGARQRQIFRRIRAERAVASIRTSCRLISLRCTR